jgi:hypothetical protein
LHDTLLGAGGRRVLLKLRPLVIGPRDNGEQVLEGLEILGGGPLRATLGESIVYQM